MARVWKSAGRFAADRRGNFAILMGVALSVLATGAGFGVNTAQLFNAKSALQNALDAAVASTARDLTTGVIREEDARISVEAFLTANGAGAFARKGVVTLDDVIVDRGAKTVDATATANVALAFPIFGTEPVRKVGARTAAVYSDQKVEVAMMLDVTGSMARNGKIKDLKYAATNAVETLLGGQNARDPRVRVSIVPYAEAVNVGALASASVFQEKTGGINLPPYIDAPTKFVSDNTGSYSDNCATERKLPNGSADTTAEGPTAIRTYPGEPTKRYLAKVNRDDRLESKDCPRASVVPLTADAAALKRSINAFSAVGYTAGAIGIQWTRYMLSPEWRRTIANARLGDGPADTDSRKIKKIAILMTDGLFNTVYAGGNAGGVNSQGNASRANAEALCTAMKKDGIEIFTIGFDLDDRNARTVLQNCASPDTGSIRHYFEASTGSELDNAFQEIIRTTERLYLSM